MIVISDKHGQLGNMLMLFSHFIACARESDLSVSNLAFAEYAERFPATKHDLFCRFPARKSWLSENRSRRNFLYRASNSIAQLLNRFGGNFGKVRSIAIDDSDTELQLGSPGFLEVARGSQFLFVRGSGFRDAEMVRKHSEEIREFFRIPEQNQRNIDELIARARHDTDVLVGIHIRHSVLHFENTRRHFYPTRCYAEFMDQLIELFPGRRVSFLLCSDWPQDPATFSRFNVTFGTGDVVEDLYAFARCDYLVGIPSTFTMWASFYGKVPLSFIRSVDQRLSRADFATVEG
jgi:hypothetical protein